MTKSEAYEKNEIVEVDKTKVDSKKSNKRRVRIFANLWCIISFMILVLSAIQDGNLKVVLPFCPVIILVYLVIRAFTK